MEEENKPVNSDASAGVTDVPESKGLPAQEALKEIFGQEITLEEAKKKVGGLKSLVGDQKVAEYRQKAEAYDDLLNKINSGDSYVEKYARDNNVTTEEAASEIGAIRRSFEESQVENTRLNRLEEKLFLTEHPEAKPYLDDISVMAKAKGVSLDEALKLPTIQRALKQEEPKTSVIESNKRLSDSGTTLVQKMMGYKQNPTASNREDLMKEAVKHIM